MLPMEDYSNLPKEAAGAGIGRYVVASVIERSGSVLILKRPGNDFMGGIYELPSGKMETKETVEEALRRETREETGLEIESIRKYLGHFDYMSKNGKATRQFNFLVSAYGNEIILSEHDGYAWIDKMGIDKYMLTDEVKSIIMPVLA